MADHLIPGKLYRLTKNYFWFSNDIDWNDATADELAGKNAKAGDILIFIDFKSYVSWGGEGIHRSILYFGRTRRFGSHSTEFGQLGNFLRKDSRRR